MKTKKGNKTKPADPVKMKALGDDDETVNVIVETPMGSRNKFKYDEDNGIYTLAKVLPQGMTFPAAFDFCAVHKS